MSSDAKYLQDLIIQFQHQPKLSFMHFWGHTPKQEGTIDQSCLSQWFPSSFVVEGIIYKTAEQYMMASKAKCFDDEESFHRILHAKTPDEAKQLGRQVKDFRTEHWEKQRFEIVVEGNLAKFSQNAELKAFLLSTGDQILVEASPVDFIWGIGFAEQDPESYLPTQWKGLNLLGFALMQVREILRKF